MTSRRVPLVGAALLGFALMGCGSNPQPAPEAGSLYQRLGGYDAIAAVVDDFLARMLGDSRLAVFFENSNDAAKQRVRQMLVDQICAASGGPCYYVGLDMRTAHQGMGINEGDWSRAVRHLGAALDKFRVPQRERDELLGAVAALKGEIVEQ